MQTLSYVLAAIIVVLLAVFLISTPEAKEGALVGDVKDLTFTISRVPVALVDGVSTVQAAPGESGKVVTKYFGNEVTGDLNGDGVEDKAFLVTQEPGGSGTFFYLVGAIKENGGYKGTEAVALGDRIAPQTTEFKDGLVVVNYAVRKAGEPFTTQPSVAKSLWLKYTPDDNYFGEVVQNFEGESNVPR